MTQTFKIKKQLLILLLILISVQANARMGENKDFWIISHSDFNKRISKGKDITLRRYIVVPALDNNFRDILETVDESAVLAKFSFMLRRNKRGRIDNYIANHDNSLSINELIKGLYYFSKKQYTTALIHLEKFDNEAFSFLKYLLIADCNYELASESKDIRTGVEVYQAAMDKSSNELEKLIINNRIKHIRYR